MIDASRPNEVQVRSQVDAGAAFYGRQAPNQIVHIDVFHSPGDVSQVVVAAALRQAAEVAEQARRIGAHPVLADAVDVQTSMEAGGSPALSVSAADSRCGWPTEATHVAAMVPPTGAGFVYLAVQAVEQAIIRCGQELRRVEALRNVAAETGRPRDLEPYTSATDSIMRESGAGGCHSDEELAREALDAASDFGSVQALRSFLEQLGSGWRRESPYAFLDREYGDADSIVAKLRTLGLVEGDGSCLAVTEKGQALVAFIRKSARELEVKMRRLIRRAASPSRMPVTGATTPMGVRRQAPGVGARRRACRGRRGQGSPSPCLTRC